jgi:hypothetical protein
LLYHRIFQYGYKVWIPTQSYYAFATQAGCPANAVYPGRSSSIFQCLSQKDIKVLQATSFNVLLLAFMELGVFCQLRTVSSSNNYRQQLLQKQVNGVNLLSGVKYLSIMFT